MEHLLYLLPAQASAGLLHLQKGGLVTAQLTLKPLMILQQTLDCIKVAVVVISADQQLLLVDPGLLVVNISEELVQIAGLAQQRLSVGRHVLEVREPRADLLLLVEDIGRLKLSKLSQTIGLLGDILYHVLVSDDVCLHQLVLLHHALDSSEVVADLFISQQSLNLFKPQVKISYILLESLSFFFPSLCGK